MKRNAGWALAACIGIAAATPGVAGTVYVGLGGSDVPTCGATSGSGACRTIQYGIGRAVAGDTVRVLQGTYEECVCNGFHPPNCPAPGKPLSIVADAFETTGDPADRSLTVINAINVCGAPSGNPRLPAVSLGSGSQLRGFTVMGGGDSGVFAAGGVVITRNIITGSEALLEGGGIRASTSLSYPSADTAPLRIEYNDITANSALAQGGGIFVEALADASHGRTVTIHRNNVGVGSVGICSNDPAASCATSSDCGPGNTCNKGNGVLGASTDQYNAGGGGMFVRAGCPLCTQSGGQTQVEITRNVVEGNSAAESALDYGNAGGGIWAASYAYGATDNILVTDNTVRNNRVSGYGGGIAVFAYSSDAPGGQRASATITVSGNIVESNSVNDPIPDNRSYGGGIWAESIGYGDETIRISSNNQVRSNFAKSVGGGISAWNFPTGSFTQTVVVEGNVVEDNEADDGGGLDLSLQLVEPPSGSWELRASDNDVTNNRASGDFGSGGGINAFLVFNRSDHPANVIEIQGNRITGNTATLAGGGALLYLIADGTPNAHTTGSVAFRNNLVSGNIATEIPDYSVGGGIFAHLDCLGDAVGSADLNFNTVTGNLAAFGSGGVEIESFTEHEDPQDTSTPEGEARVSVTDSILFDNDGFGVGGPRPGNALTFPPNPDDETDGGTGNLLVTLQYNDAFSNQGGNYEDWLVPSVGDGSMSVNPRLDSLGIPDACSPTLNAADPLADYSQEPEVNGCRADMGHLGGTPDAVLSLADVNLDHVVDGVDIIRLAASFGAYRNASWYLRAADLNCDDIVNGVDLSLIAPQSGVRLLCP